MNISTISICASIIIGCIIISGSIGSASAMISTSLSGIKSLLIDQKNEINSMRKEFEDHHKKLMKGRM